MNRILQTIMLTALLGGSAIAQLADNGMARIPGGVYQPLFRAEQAPPVMKVRPFQLDVVPVSNGDYLEFLKANPQWQRSQVDRSLADALYLRDWTGDLEPGTNAPLSSPVTYISWHAAKAYAQWKGKRLPTVAEWEYAASVGYTQLDGSKDEALRRQLMEWYSTQSSRPGPVGKGATNYFGVQDLHGLVWEWVADFSAGMSGGDSRADVSTNKDLFCGGGAIGAIDPSNFPAFMRHAFRSSLKADYCIGNLGFRCARDLPPILQTKR